VPVAGLRSEGKALVIELLGPASALAFRRRTKRNAPTPMPRIAAPPRARYAGLSSISSTKDFSGGGAAFLGAALGAGFASAVFGASAFGASATFGVSVIFAASVFAASVFAASEAFAA